MQARTATSLSLAALIGAGCAADPGPLPEPREANRGFTWKAVDTNAHGCTRYTKRATREDVVVDTGLYTRTPDGRFTLDPRGCLDTETTQHKERD